MYIKFQKDIERLKGSVIDNLYIYDNKPLQSLKGLENLKEIRGDLDICNNQFLQSLKGLENLKEIRGDLDICNNPSLQSLKGLENLKKVGNLYIDSNPSLQSLKGLENLKEIEGGLYIRNNPLLKSIDISHSNKLYNQLKCGDIIRWNYNNTKNLILKKENDIIKLYNFENKEIREIKKFQLIRFKV